MTSIYVYYRVTSPAQAGPAAIALMQDVEKRCGVRGKLMQRPDDPTTWMEVYEPIEAVETFMAALEAAQAAADLTDWLAPGSRRHIERFVPVSAW